MPGRHHKEAKEGKGLISHREALHHAIDGFVRENSNFESTIPINAAIEDIGKCADLQAAFAIPLQRQLFSLDAALRWVLFLTVAPDHADTLAAPGAAAPGALAFSSRSALALVAQVYDLGVQLAVVEHFETDGESDEEEDEK